MTILAKFAEVRREFGVSRILAEAFALVVLAVVGVFLAVVL